MFRGDFLARGHAPSAHELKIIECVKAFLVASETYDLQVCQLRDEEGLGRPTTGRELADCNNYAREQQRIHANAACITLHQFREACRRFSMSSEWGELRRQIVNAPRKLQ